MLSYRTALLLVCAFATYLSVLLYFHVRHHFWSIQSMVHVYSVFSLFKKPGCIKSISLNTKYSAPLSVATIRSTELTDDVKDHVCTMLTDNFGSEDEANFTRDTFLPLLDGHDTDCFLSIYYKYSNVVGCITGRPLTMHTGSSSTPLYVIDYLCVARDLRNKGLARSLMQTHEHNQRSYAHRRSSTSCVPERIVSRHSFSTRVHSVQDSHFPE